MKYCVLKIENNIVVLESIIDNSKKYISLSDINFKVNENDILLFDGNKYILDDEEKNKRIERIRSKMERLRKN